MPWYEKFVPQQLLDYILKKFIARIEVSSINVLMKSKL